MVMGKSVCWLTGECHARLLFMLNKWAAYFPMGKWRFYKTNCHCSVGLSKIKTNSRWSLLPRVNYYVWGACLQESVNNKQIHVSVSRTICIQECLLAEGWLLSWIRLYNFQEVVVLFLTMIMICPLQVTHCIYLLWSALTKPRFWCTFLQMLNGILLMKMLFVW